MLLDVSVLSSVLDSLDEHIAVLDEEGNIVATNEAWRQFASENGASDEGAYQDSNYLDVLLSARGEGSEDALACLQGLKQVLEDEVPRFRMEYPCDSPTEQRWFLMTATKLGNDRAVVVSHVDITERKLKEATVFFLANHDPLTGLLNRRAFLEQAQRALYQAEREQLSCAFLFIDLDGFKALNDSYGHQAGDDLLKQVAERLQAQSRRSDLTARFGGDEFVMLLVGASHNQCQVAVDRHYQALTTPFEIGSQAHTLGCSVGVALYPEHGASVDELARYADLTMYQVKAGGGGIRVYQPD